MCPAAILWWRVQWSDAVGLFSDLHKMKDTGSYVSDNWRRWWTDTPWTATDLEESAVPEPSTELDDDISSCSKFTDVTHKLIALHVLWCLTVLHQHTQLLLFLKILKCPQEYNARGLKTRAKDKISTVVRGPDLRQDKMTQKWAPSCSTVSRLTAAGTGRRDLGMRHSSDDRPRSESQDPTHSAGRDSRRRSVERDSLKEGQNIWIASLLKQFQQRQYYYYS